MSNNMSSKIDINCDMGESYGNYVIGNDEVIFPYINSCNIACGVHAGDPYHIEKTIDLALANGTRIGAHPGYPDLQGFGRRVIPISQPELSSYIKYQVSAIKGIVESKGGRLAYVKPHGALYNEIARNKEVALTVYKAIKSIDNSLSVMGLAGSHVASVLKELNMKYIPEAFADRQYEADGKLRSRTLANAIIQNGEKAAEQVLSIANEGKTHTLDGTEVLIQAESFCIHGDNPAAVEILREIRKRLN